MQTRANSILEPQPFQLMEYLDDDSSDYYYYYPEEVNGRHSYAMAEYITSNDNTGYEEQAQNAILESFQLEQTHLIGKIKELEKEVEIYQHEQRLLIAASGKLGVKQDKLPTCTNIRNVPKLTLTVAPNQLKSNTKLSFGNDQKCGSTSINAKR